MSQTEAVANIVLPPGTSHYIVNLHGLHIYMLANNGAGHVMLMSVMDTGKRGDDRLTISCTASRPYSAQSVTRMFSKQAGLHDWRYTIILPSTQSSEHSECQLKLTFKIK